MSEKSTSIGVQVLVVVFAVGLAGGYIVYRNRSTSPAIRPLVDEKQETGIEQDRKGGFTLGEAEPVDSVIMSSSKSISPAIEMTEELRTLMSSSKSGVIVPPVQIEPPKQQPEKEKPKKPRTIMPGSKSSPMKFIETPESE